VNNKATGNLDAGVSAQYNYELIVKTLNVSVMKSSVCCILNVSAQFLAILNKSNTWLVT